LQQAVVINPGFGLHRVQTVLFLTTGSLFVMWLGEQITERGLGNGASLLIFFSIVERFCAGDRLRPSSSSSTGAVEARSRCSRSLWRGDGRRWSPAS
jgi:preprotein translocase subunit SecY